MSATTRHPAHDLFDHWWVPGGLQRIVLRNYEQNPSVLADPEELARNFRSVMCPGIAQIIDYIASEPGLLLIGSGSIDVGHVVGLEPTQSPWELQEIYFGSRRHDISALEWFAYLWQSFDEVPVELRPVLDKVCEALFVMVSAPSRPMSSTR